MGKGSNTVIPFNFFAFTGGKEEKTSYGVSVKEVWPKSISPQDLNQASSEIQRGNWNNTGTVHLSKGLVRIACRRKETSKIYGKSPHDTGRPWAK